MPGGLSSLFSSSHLRDDSLGSIFKAGEGFIQSRKVLRLRRLRKGVLPRRWIGSFSHLVSSYSSRPRVETGEGIAHVEKPRCVPSPGFLYSFVLPEVFASANVYRVVIGIRFVSSEKSKERGLRSGIDDGEQIVEEDGIAIVIVSPRRFREFPHLVMYPTSGRDAQPEQLVEDVETTTPFLRPATGREIECAVGGPEKGRVIWYYQI